MSASSSHSTPAAVRSPADSQFSPAYWTRTQTAEYLNVSPKWLAQSGRRSGPSYHRFGSSVRYEVKEVRRWADQQRVRKP